MSKEEFQIIVMLYAAIIDGNIHENEVEQMLQKTNPTTFEKTKKNFCKMSDAEIWSQILEYKEKFIPDDKAKEVFIEDIHSILVADNRYLPIEAHLLHTLKKILE
jgi:hypothetical protein